MKITKLLPLLLVVGCADNNATKQESVQIFAAATSAMSTAQAKAVTQARATSLVAPAEVSLDFTGPCTLGGTVSLTGNYAGDGNDEHAVFDLATSFAGCREVTGTLDGSLQWTSEATGTSFTATMTGDLSWQGADGDASCSFDLSLVVDAAGISYGGHLCGYDVQAELGLGH